MEKPIPQINSWITTDHNLIHDQSMRNPQLDQCRINLSYDQFRDTVNRGAHHVYSQTSSFVLRMRGHLGSK